MKVAIFQIDVLWCSPKDNRSKIENFVEKFAKDADLIVLPEMFTTGFTMDTEQYAESCDGVSVAWLKDCAVRYKKAFCGSICVKDGDAYYNRLFFNTPEGISYEYDKRHLFRMAGEQNHYKVGDSKLIVDYMGFKICPMVCYDLRFPVWSRNTNNSYDILIYVASWPEVRRYPWSTLLKARAIENISYCIGVNRVGEDNNNIKYSGDSVILDFTGNEICAATPSKEEVCVVELDKSKLDEFRKKFPAYMDADEFIIK